MQSLRNSTPNTARILARTVTLAFLVLSTSACRTRSSGFEFPLLPTRANDAATAAAGSVELEIGLAATLDESISLPLVGKLGLGPRTELFATGQPLLASEDDEARGLDDFGLGLRQRWVEESRNLPAFALQASGTFLSGRPGWGLGSRDADLALAAILTKTTETAGAILFHEIGWNGDGEDHGLEQTTALAGAMGIAEPAALFAELAHDWKSERSDPAGSIACGSTLALTPWLTLQLGIAVEISEAEPRTTLTVGLTGVASHPLAPLREGS